MSLRFVFGRAGSGKSYFCYEDMKKNFKQNEDNLILIVPDNINYEVSKNILEFIGENASLKTYVLGFKRLAHRIFGEQGGIGKELLNSAGKNMIIYYILNKHVGKLKAYKNPAKLIGFVSDFNSIISEFIQFNITPDIIKSTISNIDNKELKLKLEDICIVYEEFLEKLSEGYYDEYEVLNYVLDKMNNSKLLKNTRIWIDDFKEFTSQQYKVIEKLLKLCKRVTITMDVTGDDEREIFNTIRSTERKLLKIIQDNNISLDEQVDISCDPCKRFEGESDLSYLERNIFLYPARNYEYEPSNIEIFRGKNTYSEVEYAARKICEFIRDKGIRYKDVAVICSSLEIYESLIETIFKEYEISYFLDKRRESKRNNLIIAIFSSLEVIIKNFSFESVVSFLKTGFVRVSEDEISNEENRNKIDRFENYLLATGTKGKKMWLLNDRWEYFPFRSLKEEISNREVEYMKEVNEIKNFIAERFIKIDHIFSKKQKISTFCKEMYEFLLLLKFPKTIENTLVEFRKNNLEDKFNEYRQVWNIFIEILDQLVEALGDIRVDGEEFYRILLSSIEDYEIGVIPSTIDEVMVSSSSRWVSKSVDYLFVLGVNDGLFPKAPIEEGILSDSDRNMLNEKGVELFLSSREKLLDSSYDVYKTMTSASKHLTLSYAISDIKGSALRSSIIISRIKYIFNKLKEKTDMNVENEDVMFTIQRKLPALNASIENEKNEIYNTTISWFKDIPYWSNLIENYSKGFKHESELMIKDRMKLKKLHGENPIKMSVSKLEAYARCPFSFFAKYGLNAKNRKVNDFSLPEEGDLLHNIIEGVSYDIKSKKNWERIDENYCTELVDKIFDEQLELNKNSVLKNSTRFNYRVVRQKKVVIRTLMTISDHMKNGKFIPLGYEMIFSESGKFKPIILELASKDKVYFTGKVDRIDILEKDEKTYIRIIDYKSGSKEFSLSDAYYGFKIQLIVYLNAIINELTLKNSKPAGILYLKIQDSLISEEALGEDENSDKINEQIRMEGLVLQDMDIIKSMDSDIKGRSKIIPVTLLKDGEFRDNSSVISEENFDMLMQFITNKVKILCEEIFSGNIRVRPMKEIGTDKHACEYCDFSSFCGFDTTLLDNKYNLVRKLKDSEVLQKIEEELHETMD